MSLRENSAANDDIAMSICEALEHLQPNQALSLRRYYLEDSTLDMIAEELGVSRERARQIRVAGEKHLRADFIVLAQVSASASRADLAGTDFLPVCLGTQMKPFTIVVNNRKPSCDFYDEWGD